MASFNSPDPLGPDKDSAHIAMLNLTAQMDMFLGNELNRMFGKPLVDLYKEQRKQIPGVEFNIYQLPAEQNILVKRKAQLKFRGVLISERLFIIYLKKPN